MLNRYEVQHIFLRNRIIILKNVYIEYPLCLLYIKHYMYMATIRKKIKFIYLLSILDKATHLAESIEIQLNHRMNDDIRCIVAVMPFWAANKGDYFRQPELTDQKKKTWPY